MGYADPELERPYWDREDTPMGGAVLRLSGNDAISYLRQPVLPPEPVVFPDIMERCPAVWKWTPQYFRATYPDLTCEVQGRVIALKEQLGLMEASTEEHPAPYPFNFDVAARTPELMDDLYPTIHFGSTDRTFHPLIPRFMTGGTIVHELFFGGRGSSYPQLHFDLLGMHTQITQIHGEKEFFLFDPAQSALLYPDPQQPRISSIPDIFAPDFHRFPAFRQAVAKRVLLRRGETLYFPAGWWHTTRMYGPSITYGRCVLNASNWGQMLRENRARWQKTHPLLALPTYVAGKALGGVLSVTEKLHWPSGSAVRATVRSFLG